MNSSRKPLFYLLFFTVVALLASACSGQPIVETSGAAGSSTEVISVTGTGSARGNPDMANVSVGVNVSDTQISEAVELSNGTIEEITSALVGLGIEEASIQTSNFNIWPEEVFDRETGQNTGERIYHVDSTLQIRIESIDMVGQVLQTAIESGANNVYGLNFTIQDSSTLAGEARAAAIRDARTRAEQIAEELGVELGQVVSATEVSGGQIMPFAAAEGMGGGGEPPISEGQLAVSVMMEVVFQIVR